MTQNLDEVQAGLSADVFVLPERFVGTRYERIFNEVSSRLRAESSGLPMNTLQNLMIERIAYTYITMKEKEDNQSWVRPSEQKELQAFWTSLTTEFHKSLNASTDKAREALIAEVHKIVLETVNIVSNEDERKKMRLKLAEDFARVGL